MNNSKYLTAYCLSGDTKKPKRRALRKTPVKKKIPEVLCQNTEQGSALPDCARLRQLPASSLTSTPRRSTRIQKTREIKLTSTPVESSSLHVFNNTVETLIEADPVELEYAENITKSKVTFSVLTFIFVFFCFSVNTVNSKDTV